MSTNIERSVQKAACSSLLFLSALGAAGQAAFQNLGFENTTITTVGNFSFATRPGWSWSPPGNALNADPNTVAFNNLTLDAPQVTLHETDDPWGHPAIQGNYSVFLEGGSMFIAPQAGGASVFQTGQIPDTAKSLIYLGGASLEVSFAGKSLSPIALESTPSYTEWGVDISPYSGQTGELRMSVAWETRSMLDGIQFSSALIPEPSALSLSLLGFVLVRAFARWASRSRPPTPGEGLLRSRTPLAQLCCARRWA
jgi:hypothetical protein